MPLQKHKVPGHLEQPDHILFGLTARQTLLLACGIACAGIVWVNNGGGLLQTALALILVLAALLAAGALAFLAPAGRGLEVWAIVCLTYVCSARLYLWRPLVELAEDEMSVVPESVIAAAAAGNDEN